MKETPHESRYVLYNARTLFSEGSHEEAKELFKKVLSFEDLGIADKAFIYRSLSICDKKNTVHYLKKCIETDPQRREGYVLLAAYYFRKNKWGTVYKYAKLATDITKKKLDMSTDNFAWGYLPYNLLAVGRNNKNIFKKKLQMNLTSIVSLHFDLFGEVKNSNSEDNISI
jgi:tetratricopeptide (TPR) repeat protein